MSTSRITKQELRMLEDGYVSTRMAAKKTGYHQATIIRWVNEGHLDVSVLGSQSFVSIASLKKHLGLDATQRLGLEDWSGFQEGADV